MLAQSHFNRPSHTFCGLPLENQNAYLSVIRMLIWFFSMENSSRPFLHPGFCSLTLWIYRSPVKVDHKSTKFTFRIWSTVRPLQSSVALRTTPLAVCHPGRPSVPSSKSVYITILLQMRYTNRIWLWAASEYGLCLIVQLGRQTIFFWFQWLGWALWKNRIWFIEFK